MRAFSTSNARAVTFAWVTKKRRPRVTRFSQHPRACSKAVSLKIPLRKQASLCWLLPNQVRPANREASGREIRALLKNTQFDEKISGASKNAPIFIFETITFSTHR